MHKPPYKKFPILQNQHVMLREIIEGDIENILEISYYDAVQSTTIEQAIDVNKKITNDYLEGNAIHWGIVDILTNTIVGTCGYYRGFENLKGELGCVLLREYRGKGFMYNAMTLAINFGFDYIGLQKIMAITNQHNQNAINLLQRLQFKQSPLKTENELITFEIRIPSEHNS